MTTRAYHNGGEEHGPRDGKRREDERPRAFGDGLDPATRRLRASTLATAATHSAHPRVADGRVRARPPRRLSSIAEMRSNRDLRHGRPLERLRERIAHVDRGGWLFAQIADDVARRRVQQGLSQKDLAALVGTTQSAIARLERGGRPPRIDTLLKIADALDCDLAVELRPRST